MSEVLTAWGKPGASIGRMIDVMQPDISLDGGLLTPHGFQRGAQAFGYRADISWNLTYKQLLYITNQLGLPVIVNVRISYGYYHFFAGGHFLVVTGGDDQGLTIVDSSEYYIRYLPLDTFASMFTGMTAMVVPQGYTYTVP
jgi:ABC-type bacteriocin/lantibiotic exporter with double-glycine peptidase domain